MFKKLRQTVGWFFMILIITGLVFFLATQTAILYQLLGTQSAGFAGLKGDKIGVLKLDGGIFDVEKELEVLREYEENDSIKGVLLEVNSPGGLVGPSQELSKGINRITETGKPVVASIRTVGASGGYYVASSADTIIANPGSMVGSIGVIIEFMKFKELIDKVGVGYRVIKSGEYKDIGSPFRDMEEDERELMRTLIMDVYDQFINHILDQRPNSFSRTELERLADGRVFTGRQALERNLIDETGTRREAIRRLGEAAGLGKDPQTVNLGKQRISMFRGASESFANLFGWLDQSGPSFRLLYMMPDVGSVDE